MAGVTLPDKWTEQMSAALQARNLATVDAFTVSVQITGVEGGDVTAAWQATDKRMVLTDSADDAAVVIIIAAKDAVSIMTGDTPFAVEFMRGKVKLSGDAALSMDLLKASSPLVST